MQIVLFTGSTAAILVLCGLILGTFGSAMAVRRFWTKKHGILSALMLQCALVGTPSQDPVALLQGLRTLDRELVKLEHELGELKAQEAKLQEDVAGLDVELSEVGIQRDIVTQALQTRIRALDKMPGGARMVALGTTQSLQDYLAISRMLRWLARHDQSLKQEHEKQAAQSSALKTSN